MYYSVYLLLLYGVVIEPIILHFIYRTQSGSHIGLETMPLGDRITSTSNVIGSESTVGNIDWIRQQSDVVFNFVYNDVEDFAYAARRDIEWIDEHMTELLNQETTNIPSLFKTPGRLRGVPSPRKLKSTTNKENVKVSCREV